MCQTGGDWRSKKVKKHVNVDCGIPLGNNQHIYSCGLSNRLESHFMKQNADFQEGISQAL